MQLSIKCLSVVYDGPGSVPSKKSNVRKKTTILIWVIGTFSKVHKNI